MFYIIETQEQLDKFKTYDLSDSFVEFITQDDRMHPALSEVSLVYIKPSKSRTGFILPVDHSEGFSLPLNDIIALIDDKVHNLTVLDAKKAKYHLNEQRSVKDLKMFQFLENGKDIDSSTYNTVAHNFLYGKYPSRIDINKLIPISKHQEKWNNLVKDLKIKQGSYKKYHSFYSNDVNNAFRKIESNGIGVDHDRLFNHYTLKNPLMSEISGMIFSQYNLYTATGRPSNAFNGINFAAMNKGDSSREFIIPKHDRLIEMDYSSYHPRILADLVDYSFEEEDIHTHLGKMYFGVDELTQEQYDESKGMTFKNMYTNQGDNLGIPFFDKVKELKDYLWEMYKEKGYIKSPLSKMKLKGIESKTKILPYLLQKYETERNVIVINQLHEYLVDKTTELVMYSYDSFLFDYSNHDEPEIIQDLKNILEDGNRYPVSLSQGKNYATLKRFTL